MIFDTIFLTLLFGFIGFIGFIIFTIGRRDFYGELGRKFRCNLSASDKDLLSWTPLLIRQRKLLSIPPSRIGVKDGGILIGYFFPFSVLLPSIYLREAEIENIKFLSSCRFKGVLITLVGFPGQEILISTKYSKKLEGKIFAQFKIK